MHVLSYVPVKYIVDLLEIKLTAFAADKTILIIQSALAPPDYCTNGGRTERCTPPRCAFPQMQFTNWTDPVSNSALWFNQYVRFPCPRSLASQLLSVTMVSRNEHTLIHIQFLENLMLRRWKTAKWKFPDPIVIVPSPYTQCIRG